MFQVVFRVFQVYVKEVYKVCQGSFNEVSGSFKELSRMFKESFKGVSWQIEGDFKGDFSWFQVYLKEL